MMTEDPNEPAAEVVDLLLVIDDGVVDRLGSIVRHLCVGMIDESVRMTVLSRSARQSAADAIGPARVVRLPSRNRFWHGVSAAEVTDLIGNIRPSIVHCLSSELARWVQGWSELWKCDLVVHLADIEDVSQFSRRVRLEGTTAIAATTTIAEALLSEQPALKDRICVVPMGIPAQAEPACYNLTDCIPVVVISTPLTKDSGMDVVLKAAHSVIKAGHELQLFVLETGPAERIFRQQVEKLDLRSNVTFSGKMRDWATFGQAVRAADMYIEPGTRRRFTIKTLTAMAEGLAILAPSGTIEDYLIDGETASLFTPLDARDLARKWTILLKDHAFSQQLAQGALDHVRSHHQASGMVSKTAEFYRRVRELHKAGQIA